MLQSSAYAVEDGNIERVRIAWAVLLLCLFYSLVPWYWGPYSFSLSLSLSGNSSHSLENLCSSKKRATFSNSAFMLLLKQRMLKKLSSKKSYFFAVTDFVSVFLFKHMGCLDFFSTCDSWRGVSCQYSLYICNAALFSRWQCQCNFESYNRQYQLLTSP